jgi:hypothetical protein
MLVFTYDLGLKILYWLCCREVQRSQQGMELFQNTDYVLLQSLAHATYIHASEDGRSVRLDASPQTSHNAVWAVERCFIGGICHIRLRGVYGRYLGTPDRISSFFPQVSAVQLDFDKPDMREVTWLVSMTGDNTFQLKAASGPILSASIYFSESHTVREWKVYSLGQRNSMPHVSFVTVCSIRGSVLHILSHLFL